MKSDLVDKYYSWKFLVPKMYPFQCTNMHQQDIKLKWKLPSRVASPLACWTETHVEQLVQLCRSSGFRGNSSGRRVSWESVRRNSHERLGIFLIQVVLFLLPMRRTSSKCCLTGWLVWFQRDCSLLYISPRTKTMCLAPSSQNKKQNRMLWGF